MVATNNSGKSLGTLKKGSLGIVSHFSNPNIGGKLMAMGVLPGSSVQIIRRGPLGASCYLKVDNLFIALRQAELAAIILR